MVFLHSHGVGTARAVWIFKTYGNDAVQVMAENPYRQAVSSRIITTAHAINAAPSPICARHPRVRAVRVLCPMARGSCGSRSLNIELQKLLNPDPAEQVERFEWRFAPGDKVIQIANDRSGQPGSGLRLGRARSSGAGLRLHHPQEPGQRLSRRGDTPCSRSTTRCCSAISSTRVSPVWAAGAPPSWRSGWRLRWTDQGGHVKV